MWNLEKCPECLQRFHVEWQGKSSLLFSFILCRYFFFKNLQNHKKYFEKLRITKEKNMKNSLFSKVKGTTLRGENNEVCNYIQ
jgi:hypothetical protein